MDHRIFLTIALIVSNLSLFYLSISVMTLLHGAQRRSHGFVKSKLSCFMQYHLEMPSRVWLTKLMTPLCKVTQNRRGPRYTAFYMTQHYAHGQPACSE